MKLRFCLTLYSVFLRCTIHLVAVVVQVAFIVFTRVGQQVASYNGYVNDFMKHFFHFWLRF